MHSSKHSLVLVLLACLVVHKACASILPLGEPVNSDFLPDEDKQENPVQVPGEDKTENPVQVPDEDKTENTTPGSGEDNSDSQSTITSPTTETETSNDTITTSKPNGVSPSTLLHQSVAFVSIVSALVLTSF